MNMKQKIRDRRAGKRPGILIIGGSRLQVPQVRWAAGLGLHTTVTDRNPDTPGLELADCGFVADGTDEDRLLELAERIRSDRRLAGVYTGNDFGLAAAARINREFGLFGCRPVNVQNSLDKSRAKQLWAEAGLPVPRGIRTENFREAFTAAGDFRFPVMVKPLEGSGSRGVRSVWREEELRPAFDEAQAISPVVLVEELVLGRHLDVNGLWLDGRFHRCGIAERFFSPPPYAYPLWGYQEAILDESRREEIYRLVQKASSCLGIREGPVKADLIVQDDSAFLIEMAPRFHGDIGTSFVTPLVSGCNPVRSLFAHLARIPDAEQYLRPTHSRTAGWAALFPDVCGTLNGIQGVSRVRQQPAVHEVLISASVGDRIGPHRDNTTLCGFVVASADDRNSLKRLLDQATKTIRFICR